MPVRDFITDPAEWARHTGEYGSVYFDTPMKRKPKRPARAEEQQHADEAPPSPIAPTS
jgi:hypothetical protein